MLFIFNRALILSINFCKNKYEITERISITKNIFAPVNKSYLFFMLSIFMQNPIPINWKQ